MDQTEVTNAQFQKFVEATGYVTVAERPVTLQEFSEGAARDFISSLKEPVEPGSLVFVELPGATSLSDFFEWWRWQPGASWKHPEGPDSSLTEDEWEYAARAGLDRKTSTWGDQKQPDGKAMANIWTGDFPTKNTAEDGWPRSAPVKSYPPNAFGLHDMSGNVWEWTADWYRPEYYKNSPEKNPRGPADSHDPDEAGLPKKVMRGGSFLCSDTYCLGYQPGRRSRTSPDTALQHLGFRCVKSP